MGLFLSSVIWSFEDFRGGTERITAGSGNRTRVASLENWCTTTVLYPQSGGQGRVRRLRPADHPVADHQDPDGYLAATYLMPVALGIQFFPPAREKLGRGGFEPP